MARELNALMRYSIGSLVRMILLAGLPLFLCPVVLRSQTPIDSWAKFTLADIWSGIESMDKSVEMGITFGHVFKPCWYESHHYGNGMAGLFLQNERFRIGLRTSYYSDKREGDPERTYLYDKQVSFHLFQTSISYLSRWYAVGLGVTASYSKYLYSFRYDQEWRGISDPGFELGYFDLYPGIYIRLGPERIFLEIDTFSAQILRREPSDAQFALGYDFEPLRVKAKLGFTSTPSGLCGGDEALLFASCSIKTRGGLILEPVWYQKVGLLSGSPLDYASLILRYTKLPW